MICQQKLTIGDDVHHQFKAYCKRRGWRMKAVIERLICAEIGQPRRSAMTPLPRTPAPEDDPMAAPPFWAVAKPLIPGLK